MPLRLSFSPRFVAILCLAAILLAAGLYEMTPGQRLKARQEALVEWARDGAPGDFARKFTAADYLDQWHHSAGDIAERVRAARFVHPGYTIETAEPDITRSGDMASVTQMITIRPGDGETLEHEFRFTWHRESIWPWSWKLRAVHAPDLRF